MPYTHSLPHCDSQVVVTRYSLTQSTFAVRTCQLRTYSFQPCNPTSIQPACRTRQLLQLSLQGRSTNYL